LRDADLLERRSARPIALGGDADASEVDFRPFVDLRESVRESLCAVREAPFLPDSLELSGWIYDVRDGRVAEVSEVAKAA
jgi:carbonic anhydrase